jgi:MFS family permease
VPNPQLADVWSRPHALALSVALYALGYAMCAGAKNVATVVAGQFVYTLGNTGITFRTFEALLPSDTVDPSSTSDLFLLVNSLLIADITSLQWRAFANGAVNLPYVVNAFVGKWSVISQGQGREHILTATSWLHLGRNLSVQRRRLAVGCKCH